MAGKLAGSFWVGAIVWLHAGALALTLSVALPAQVHAQMRALPSAPDAPALMSPSMIPPPPTLAPSGSAPPAAPPVAMTPAQSVPQVPVGQVALVASARFGREVPQPISGGLLWRVYPA